MSQTKKVDAEAYQAICQAADDGISFNDLKALGVTGGIQKLLFLGMIRRRKVDKKKFVYVATKRPVEHKPNHS